MILPKNKNKNIKEDHFIKKRNPESTLFWIGIFAPMLIALGYWTYQKLIQPMLFWEGCIWESLFHFYCPGCGGTRAFQAFMNGKFLLSAWLHPLVPYSIILYLIFMISQLINKCSAGRIKAIRFHSWFLYAAIVIIIVNWAAKNLLRFVWNITI